MTIQRMNPWAAGANLLLAFLLAACGCSSAASRRAVDMRRELSRYNVVWNTPGPDASASMPIGNGTVGANVWVEPSGDLVFYLSRTDAWSENERLLKLGRVRVSVSPNPLATGGSVRQELVLGEGRIDVSLQPAQGRTLPAPVALCVWVDSHDPVVHVTVRCEQEVQVAAQAEIWRTQTRHITDADELRSAWAMRDAPAGVEVIEAGDVVVGAERAPGAVAWYHRNEHSIVPFTVHRQGLGRIADAFHDPLIHRTIGCWMEGTGLRRTGADRLVGQGKRIDLSIVTDARQTDTAEAWISGVEATARQAAGATRSRSGTAAWWRKFWERSWIFIEGDPPLNGVPENNQALRIGVDSNGQNQFHGLMAQPWIFRGALTDDQVKRLASLGRAQPSLAEPSLSPLRARLAFEPPAAVDAQRPLATEFRLPGADLTGPVQLSTVCSEGLTLSAWIHPDPGPDQNPAPARVFDKMTAGGSDGFLFDTHPGKSLRLICGRHTLDVKDVLHPGRWQHVAASYDAATGSMKIYHDGALVAHSPASVNADPAPRSQITRSYILQRWVLACSSRGTMYPPKFNGSIFTVEPRYVNGRPWSPDWRAWGGSYWWQNTRLAYYPMLAAGDYDLMHPLFDFYGAALEPSRARAREYYGADGAYFPETMTMFFTYANGDYGWNRQGLAPGDISPCPWWKWAWNQSLELTQIMLDYYDHTGDEEFLRQRVLPMAAATLDYFHSRFVRNDPGPQRHGRGHAVMNIVPTQALETYWKDVEDDAPTVAGIRCVTQKVLALPAHLLPVHERERCETLLGACAALPTRTADGVRVAAPARAYKDERSNVETPELYPVFPFGLVGIGRPGMAPWVEAYQRRHDKAAVGWTQDGAFAAMLGMPDEAQAQLIARARNSHRNFRFPAMWGPNFDWLPDQCHGGNLMLLTQLMLMQPVGDKVYLLPAWPTQWNARFRLHAPRGTVIEGVVRMGRVEELEVWPASRRKDVIVWRPEIQAEVEAAAGYGRADLDE